jgi:methylglyoxal synthase
VEPFARLPMEAIKRVALIAHDNKKTDIVEWVRFNKDLLAHHDLYATRTTGRLIAEQLGLRVTEFQSGPLGGDQQIGARIADGCIDVLVFFWDPLEPLPHDPDVRALLRIAVVWNIPVACNRATADFVISSPLMADAYDRLVPAYGAGESGGRDRAAPEAVRPNDRVASREPAASTEPVVSSEAAASSDRPTF